jgi:hypothetical protein
MALSVDPEIAAALTPMARAMRTHTAGRRRYRGAPCPVQADHRRGRNGPAGPG